MKIIITGDTHYGFSDETGEILRQFWGRVDAENAQAVLHAGDWTTSNPKDFIMGMAQATSLVRAQIFTVMGNHDYWNDEHLTDPLDTQALFRKTADELRIEPLGRFPNGSSIWSTHIASHPKGYASTGQRVCIVGTGGWYCHRTPPTNDTIYMPGFVENRPVHEYMHQEHVKAIDRIYENLDINRSDYKIFLTHFPGGDTFGAAPYLTEIMASRCQMIVRGHSHKAEDFMMTGDDENYLCRIVNSGSDYDDPKYLVVEV